MNRVDAFRRGDDPPANVVDWQTAIRIEQPIAIRIVNFAFMTRLPFGLSELCCPTLSLSGKSRKMISQPLDATRFAKSAAAIGQGYTSSPLPPPSQQFRRDQSDHERRNDRHPDPERPRQAEREGSGIGSRVNGDGHYGRTPAEALGMNPSPFVARFRRRH